MLVVDYVQELCLLRLRIMRMLLAGLGPVTLAVALDMLLVSVMLGMLAVLVRMDDSLGSLVLVEV
jgi:hypothetical protein